MMLTCPYSSLLCATQAVQKSSEWQVGTYVRVHGNLSDFDGNYRIQAFNVRAITDFNEVRLWCLW